MIPKARIERGDIEWDKDGSGQVHPWAYDANTLLSAEFGGRADGLLVELKFDDGIQSDFHEILLSWEAIDELMAARREETR